MDLSGAAVLVTGAGVTGRAILAALTPLGARATLTDDSPSALTTYAQNGVAVIDAANAVERITDFDLVVTSPGLPPTAPVLAAAAAAGVPIWGDVELAWRLDNSGRYGPPRRWLVVTGTNGKTTTTSMLHAMLVAAGRRALLCGNIGDPVLDVLDQPAELLAVELSSFQLHWAPSLRPEAGVVLNVAEDHLDWHGTMDAYARDKARVLDGRVAVVGLDDPVAAGLLSTAAAPVRVGFRLGEPAPGSWGCATACSSTTRSANSWRWPRRRRSRWQVRWACSTRWPPRPWPARSTCRRRPSPRRWRGFGWAGTAPRSSATSTASRMSTTPRPPTRMRRRRRSAAYPRVVWIAGGLLKGASVDELVAGGGESPGRSGADRPRPDPDPRRVIATRPGCPRRRACDGGGFWGAWGN